MLRVETYEKFKKCLLTGALRPGQFVTQRELMDLVGVPLGSAREAIQRLEYEGLVRVFPQRGIQIVDVTVSGQRDTLEYRQILEMHAIRHYARHAAIPQMEALEEATRAVLQRMSTEEVDAALLEQAVEVDWRMHDEIIDSLGNEIVSASYRVNAARIRLMRTTQRQAPARSIEAMKEHLAILQAARARDVEGAAAALERHLQVSRQRAIEAR
jgi:DNA-binding GntR family transcriptional regulator